MDGREARDEFLAKVRARVADAPYFVDPGGGFGGSTVVTGPTLRAGFIMQSANDKRPDHLAEQLNGAWACGFEQARADYEARACACSHKEDAEKAQAERNGIISRLRAHWPHIELPTKVPTARGARMSGRGLVADPGAPACLRCAIEDEIGAPWHDGLGPVRPRDAEGPVKTVLPTCHVCGDLLPDQKPPRIHCQDCAHALGEMAEAPERVGLDIEDNERGEY